MRRSPVLALALVAGTAVAVLATGVSAQQQPQQQGQAPATGRVDLLADDLAGLKGMEDKEVLAGRSELPGGFESTKHHHPGHVLVYILEGAMIFEEEGKPPVTIKAGEIYHERPGTVFVARNASDTEPVKLLAIDIKEKGQPRTIDVH